ncbi:MAG: PQQ-dependent sugar dehydrogenase [Oligoflexia bacterium]|nr:PQQ-dependent sugar dehydrogenase [Oligoflexia bacterium]
MKNLFASYWVGAFFLLILKGSAFAHFHAAPRSALGLENPFRPDDASAIRAGAALYAKNCASCHGEDAMGMGNVPTLARGPVQSVSDGELYWFIGKGAVQNGMPPSHLPARQRWQVVTFVKSLGAAPISPKSGQVAPRSHAQSEIQAPPPSAPFTDYRFEKPGEFHKIRAKDLPDPAMETSVGNGPEIVPRPAGAWPKVPEGFQVQLYATGLDNPRLIRSAPNGDVFLAESSSGKIRVFRGLTADGKPRQAEVFVAGMNRPYGIAFYPVGKDPKWVYVGNTDAVIRIPYRNGDLHASGRAQKIADLPSSSRGHWTRDLQFSLDGKKLFVAVGSASNIDDPDTTPREKNRADILVMNPEDGSDTRVYAYGIRNAGGGLAVNPVTGELWASVNERDALGDNLVPDYITRVREGGFYGWPWWYIGGHQDPRHPGKHPELKDKLIEPDVLLQPHNASLEMIFYEGKQFPAEYRGDIFAAQHGSWNRSVRTGYELIRVPLHQGQKASGDYEDFMTGFVVDDARVWGRPVGVTVAPDGSLLVTDDASNSIWRIRRLSGSG